MLVSVPRAVVPLEVASCGEWIGHAPRKDSGQKGEVKDRGNYLSGLSLSLVSLWPDIVVTPSGHKDILGLLKDRLWLVQELGPEV